MKRNNYIKKLTHYDLSPNFWSQKSPNFVHKSQISPLLRNAKVKSQIQIPGSQALKVYLAVKQGGDNPFVARTNSLRDVDGGQRVREAAGEADEEDSGVERCNQIFL